MNIVFIFYLIGAEIRNRGNEKLSFEFVLELMSAKIKTKVGSLGLHCIRLRSHNVTPNSNNNIKNIIYSKKKIILLTLICNFSHIISDYLVFHSFFFKNSTFLVMEKPEIHLIIKCCMLFMY